MNQLHIVYCMHACLVSTFDASLSLQALVIGTDIPDISAGILEAAVTALDSHQVLVFAGKLLHPILYSCLAILHAAITVHCLASICSAVSQQQQQQSSMPLISM